MLKRLHLLAVLAAVALTACAANAVQIHKLGLGLGQNVTFQFGANSQQTFAGEFLMEFVGAPPPGYEPSFTAYCADLAHFLQTYEDVTLESTDLLNPMALVPPTGPRAAWLYNTYADVVTTAMQAAALQLAIWESLYDASPDLGAGTFKVTSANASTVAQANLYLGSLLDNTDEATWFRALTHPNQQNQDLIGPRVPEPGVLALLAGAATSGLLLRRRRRPA